MSELSPASIFLDACLVNNFVLSTFLGICPFLGVSGRVETAARMAGAVAFVMLLASLSAYGINIVLEWLGAPYLRLIAYIVVIASAVQSVEMFFRKFSPAIFRALGIFLPLITTNCAILGLALFQTNREYDFIQSLAYACGAAAGFALALLLMSGLRQELESRRVDISDPVRSTTFALFIAGVLALAFMGFAGIGGE